MNARFLCFICYGPSLTGAGTAAGTAFSVAATTLENAITAVRNGAIITLSAAVAANSAPDAISALSRHSGLIVGRIRTAAGGDSAKGIIGHLVAAHAVHGRTPEESYKMI